MLQSIRFLFCFFLISLSCSPIISAQTGNLTINGNIKLNKVNDFDINECFFHYTDLLSGEAVIIPIKRDSSENFSVNMQLENYQQIYFSKKMLRNGKSVYNTGMVYFSFFAKPGQTMQLNFNQKSDTKTFKGDFSLENNQYQSYLSAQEKSVKNIYEYAENKKFTPAEANQTALNYFNKQLAFNKHYFKMNSTAPFIQQQAYFNAFYRSQSAAIALNSFSKNKITQAMVDSFCNVTINTAKTYKSALGNNTRDINSSLINSNAIGNEEYKDFVRHYFNVFARNIKLDNTVSISSKDIASYILKKYPDTKQEEKSVLIKFSSDKGTPIKEENEAMALLEERYANEYLQTMNCEQELGKYLEIKDPALRDFGATMYLYKKLNFTEIDYLQTSIDNYINGVKNSNLKNKFLSAYKERLNLLHRSTMPSMAVLNSSASLNGPDLLNKIIEKYKGKVIYLDLWATWCGPCIAAMESSQKLKEKLKDKDIIFLYLCLNSPNEAGWKNIISAERLEGENYFLNRDQSLVVTNALNVASIPHYAIIDKQGKFIDKKASGPEDPKTQKILSDILGN